MTANLNEPTKNRVLSTYEQIVQDSLQKGEQKGEQKGDDRRAIFVIKSLEEEGFSIDKIVKLTGKSEAFVTQVLEGKIQDGEK